MIIGSYFTEKVFFPKNNFKLITAIPKSIGKKMSNIQDFFKRYLPVVKADEGEEEELVDPQKVLRVSDNYYIMLSFQWMRNITDFLE